MANASATALRLTGTTDWKVEAPDYPGQVLCAAYLRISRDDKKKGLGVERQLPVCEREAARLGWKVAIVIVENDTKASGNKPRPKFQRMLQMVRDGQLGAIAGFNLDRITRKVREAEDIIDLYDALGTRVVTSNGEARLDNPNGRKEFRDSASDGVREVEMVSQRSLEESEQRAMAGRANGPVPFGWRREALTVNRAGRVLESRAAVDPEEAGALQLAAKRLLAGVSLRQVTADLEAGTVRPRRAAHWDTKLVAHLLTRDTNVGRRVFRGQVLEGVQSEWAPILDDVTFALVKQLLLDPARRTNDKGSAPQWLLSCIAKCGRKGCEAAKVRAVRGGRGKRPAYVCSRCMQRHWVDDIDAFISAIAVRQLEAPELADIGTEAYAELAALYAAQDALKVEQTQAAELVGKGITLAQLVALNAGYDARLAELDAQIKAVLPTMAANVDLEGGWDAAGLAERRAAIRALFASIVLLPAPIGKGGRRLPFSPEHVAFQLAGAAA
jgi:DNA invertase Pin-like site-specific DNA recombinase